MAKWTLEDHLSFDIAFALKKLFLITRAFCRSVMSLPGRALNGFVVSAACG